MYGGIPSPNPEYRQPIRNVVGTIVNKIQNKNLFDKNDTTTQRYIEASTGLMKELQGSSASDYINIEDIENLIMSGDTFMRTNGGAFYNSNKEYISGFTTQQICDGINVPSGSSYVRVTITTELLDVIQIEPGTTASSYVEHEEQNLPFTLAVKEYTNIEFEQGTIGSSGDLGEAANRIRTKNFYEIEQNYLCEIECDSPELYDIYVFEYDENQNFIDRIPSSWSNIPFIFKPNNNAKYIKCIFRYKNNNNILPSSISGAAIKQKQRLMKNDSLEDNGIHHKRKQIVLTGNETYYLNTNYTTETMLVVNLEGVYTSDIKSGTNQLLCSHFNYASPTVINSFRAMATSLGFGLDITEFPTVNDFKSFVTQQYANGTPVIVEYELDEEEIIPYTASQQEQYNAIKKLKSYKDMTIITSTSDELPPILEIQYWEKKGSEENEENN